MATLPFKPSQERFISCKAAADALGLSDDTIRRLIKLGKLEAVTNGKRSIRIKQSSLQSYAEGLKAKGGAA